MPIYEYQCQSCGHQFEALQKMSDPVLTDCPACAKSQLKKMVSAAAFKLKGQGWYETDFKNNGKVSNSDAKGKDKANTDSKTATGGASNTSPGTASGKGDKQNSAK